MISSPSSSPHQGMFVLADAPIPAWKRAIDIGCCVIALPILIVATVFMALLIALVSPGPVFFRQERVGYMGRRFPLYKFRTMHPGADTSVHRAHFSNLVSSQRPMQKLDSASDGRLIAGGRFLRAAGIDELPQLINVLRGDMSIVGPRPCIPYEYEQYSAWQRARFSSVPGLTGLWQVSGKNRTTFDEMVRLDITYTQTKSLWLDLKIMARTPVALWRQIADSQAQRKARAASEMTSSGAGRPAPTFQT